MKTLKKSVDINAPKQKVWDVLLNDEFTRVWYSAFNEGAHADTDWKLGSKAVFTDNSGSGMIGHIVENKPNEVISIEYDGVLKDGREDFNSEEAKAVKGSHETYRLSSHNGQTHLDVLGEGWEMDDKFFQQMSTSWDNAIQKIKSLAEIK